MPGERDRLGILAGRDLGLRHVNSALVVFDHALEEEALAIGPVGAVQLLHFVFGHHAAAPPP
jgi:hypothetical protein